MTTDPPLKLNTAVFDAYREAAGLITDDETAKRMGIHPGTLSRVLNGHLGMGPRFQQGLRRAFPGSKIDDFIEA